MSISIPFRVNVVDTYFKTELRRIRKLWSQSISTDRQLHCTCKPRAKFSDMSSATTPSVKIAKAARKPVQVLPNGITSQVTATLDSANQTKRSSAGPVVLHARTSEAANSLKAPARNVSVSETKTTRSKTGDVDASESGTNAKNGPTQSSSSVLTGSVIAATCASSGLHSDTILIKNLNPELKQWILHAQVLATCPVRHWENFRGKGKLFEVMLVDKEGTHIRATFFHDVDNYTNLLQSGSVYSFAGGQIKQAFTTERRPRAPEFELTFAQHAEVKLLPPFETPVTICGLEFVGVQDLSSATNDQKINVAGILLDVGAMKRFRLANGNEGFKRDVVIVDDSHKKVVCTLCGPQARADIQEWMYFPVLIRRAQISDYSGFRSVSVSSGSSILIGPAIQRSKELEEWFASTTATTDFTFVRPA